MTSSGSTTEQLNLPGQACVADGPHDHTGMYVMHHAFRRDLAAFASAVGATPLGDASTWAALRRRWTCFAEALHHHHHAEDEHYWPVLAQAVELRGSSSDRAEVAAMEDEHSAIDPQVAVCADAFAAMVTHPCAEHRNALDIRLAGLRELLGEHLRHEETVVLPLVQRVMTAEEFRDVDRAIGQAYPLRSVPFMIAWVMQGLPRVAQDRMVALAGRPYLVLYLLLRGRFERAERRAFRYSDGVALTGPA